MADKADIFVSPAGSDNNDGTSNKPLASINMAAELAVPGTTVHVAPGTYTENVRITKSGTAANRISYTSDVKWGANITADNFNAPVDISGDYIDFEGFDITGNATHGIQAGGSHIRIAGNHVHGFAKQDWQATNNGGAGIVTYCDGYTMHDILIIGNVVHDIGPQFFCNFIHGIYTSGDRMYVLNNIVYNTSGYGIHAWHAANRNTFANNLSFGNRRGGIVLGAGDSPGGVIADGFIVTNNIIVHNIGIGISELGLTGTNNIFENNLVFGNTVAPLVLQNGNMDVNTIQADPMFVDFKSDGSGNYRLKPGSPCIGAGTKLGAADTDAEGNKRPGSGPVDIGPYQFIA